MNPQRRTLLAIVAAMALITTSVISLKWLRAPAVEARRDLAPPFPSVGQHSHEPTPTGAWFTNLLLDDGAPSVTTPYAVRFEKKTHALLRFLTPLLTEPSPRTMWWTPSSPI